MSCEGDPESGGVAAAESTAHGFEWIKNTVLHAYETQKATAKLFYNDARFQTPIIIIWVAVFGGSLHTSVNTYFYLALGATEMDLGWVGFLRSLGGVFCAPVYGWVLDKYGAATAICLTSFSCAAGCLIRGLAADTTGLYIGMAILGLGAENLTMVVLAHISRSTDAVHRANVISSFTFQVTSLSILGKSLYPPFNYFLRSIVGVEDNMLRMRIHMGQCTIFCFYGFARLVSSWESMNQAINAGRSTIPPAKSPMRPALVPQVETTDSTGLTPHKTEHPGRFALFLFLLILQSMVMTICTMLWPLYIRDHFHWDIEQYAYLVFVSSVCGTIATAVAPAVAVAIGQARSMTLAYALAGVSALSTLDGGPIKHTIAMITILTAMAFVEPSIKASASTSMPQVFQGATFGVLSSVAGIGQMVGSPFSTYIYKLSKGLTGSSILSDGYFPFVFVAMLTLVSIVLLFVAKAFGMLVLPMKGKVSPPLTRASRGGI